MKRSRESSAVSVDREAPYVKFPIQSEPKMLHLTKPTDYISSPGFENVLKNGYESGLGSILTY